MMRQARMSPDGFVAQHFPEGDFKDPWVLTYWTPNSGLTVEVFSDEQVVDWVPLIPIV